jgi:hypothetical protein
LGKSGCDTFYSYCSSCFDSIFDFVKEIWENVFIIILFVKRSLVWFTQKIGQVINRSFVESNNKVLIKFIDAALVSCICSLQQLLGLLELIIAAAERNDKIQLFKLLILSCPLSFLKLFRKKSK